MGVMLSQDDVYIAKCMKAKVSPRRIGAKLNMNEAEVIRRWERIKLEAASLLANSHTLLCDQYTVMAHQYQLVGESLKIIAEGISNVMPAEEIKHLLLSSGWMIRSDVDMDQSIVEIQKACIILRPFKPVDPEKSLQEHLARQEDEG